MEATHALLVRSNLTSGLPAGSSGWTHIFRVGSESDLEQRLAFLNRHNSSMFLTREIVPLNEIPRDTPLARVFDYSRSNSVTSGFDRTYIAPQQSR